MNINFKKFFLMKKVKNKTIFLKTSQLNQLQPIKIVSTKYVLYKMMFFN